MATIRARKTADGKTRYHVQVRLKGFPPETASFARKTDAKEWATRTEAAIKERRYFKTAEARRRTLGELIDRYTRDVLPTKRTKTQGPQVQQLAWWKHQLGVSALADITPATLADARDKLAREPIQSTAKKQSPSAPPRLRSPATVNRYLAALSHVFTVAVKELGWMDDNPLSKVTKQKEPRGRVRFLSEDSQAPNGATIQGERTRLLTACKASDSPDLYTAVVLALSTGARQTQIMSLRWEQVDFQRSAIVLHETKNGERRALPLAGHAFALMKERSKVRRIDTGLVFPGKGKRDPRGNLCYKPVDLRTPWETALKRAGIEDFRWHDLRHSAASYLAMNGASLAEIAEVLGHKTLQMVKRYSHLSEAHTAGVVARMNQRIFGEG